MREVKFQAWDNVENKMYCTGEESDIHFYFDSNGIKAERIFNELIDSADGNRGVYGNSELLEHLIYRQYTGLKDKSGNEIYDGDIVHMVGAWGFISRTVRFEKGTFHFGYIDDGMCDHEEMIVVGNIYENPELLEE